MGNRGGQKAPCGAVVPRGFARWRCVGRRSDVSDAEVRASAGAGRTGNGPGQCVPAAQGTRRVGDAHLRMLQPVAQRPEPCASAPHRPAPHAAGMHRPDPCASGRADRPASHPPKGVDLNVVKLVGARGFEPPAPASRRQCSTRLSYTPNRGRAYRPKPRKKAMISSQLECS